MNTVKEQFRFLLEGLVWAGGSVLAFALLLGVLWLVWTWPLTAVAVVLLGIAFISINN